MEEYNSNKEREEKDRDVGGNSVRGVVPDICAMVAFVYSCHDVGKVVDIDVYSYNGLRVLIGKTQDCAGNNGVLVEDSRRLVEL